MKESFGHNKISFNDFVRDKNLGPKTEKLFKWFLQDSCGCTDCDEINEAKLYRAYDNFRQYIATHNFFYPDNKINFEENIEDFDSKFHRSYKFAKDKHDATGAIRKFSGAPYIVHPDGVAKIVDAYGGDDDQIKIAVLHDTIEDTDTNFDEIEDLFGEEVATGVEMLSNDKGEIDKMGKETYMSKKLLNLPEKYLFIKLADFLYNILDHPRESQLERMINNLIALSRNRHLSKKCNEILDACLEAAAFQMN